MISIETQIFLRKRLLKPIGLRLYPINYRAKNIHQAISFLGSIPPEPDLVKTDGYGVNFIVDPGEAVVLVSDRITMPAGPVTISTWLAVEKSDENNDDTPQITLALAEDDSNLAYTTIRKQEILGDSRYQYLSTTFDVVGPDALALVQIIGTQKAGRAEIYLDNLRIYPAKRDIDMALAPTNLPVLFDGMFESVLGGFGLFFEIDASSYGGRAYVSKLANRTVIPGGFRQSLIMEPQEPDSAIRLTVGPTEIDRTLYPRVLSVRAHLQAVREGNGVFALALYNGNQEAVTFVSDDRLPTDPDWHEITASGIFSVPGPIEPTIVLQNVKILGAFPGVILDGATIAVDDITIEAFQDTTYLWEHTLLPNASKN